jgi:hypothetical protein
MAECGVTVWYYFGKIRFSRSLLNQQRYVTSIALTLYTINVRTICLLPHDGTHLLLYIPV